MDKLNISVIVCTYNRCESLKRCLESLSRQHLDPCRFEVMVVDNASSDGTAELCRSYPFRGNFRYLFESRQGLSFARNRGLEECRAPLVAYLDDDAEAVPGWLGALLEGFAQERVACAGGPIVPVFEGLRPGWLHDSLLPLYSCRERGGVPFDLGPGLFFYGANMSFQRDVLKEVGGFPVHLGRSGNNLLSDEELVVSERIERLGYRKRYIPEAAVLHHISRERLRSDWLLKRFYWLGKGDAIRELGETGPLPQRFLPCLRQLKWTAVRLVRPEYRAGWWSRLIPLATLLGYIGQCLKVPGDSGEAESRGALQRGE